MGIQFHPGQGTVVICDYSTGFIVPEMVKRRPVIIICKPRQRRPRLCTVIPLSTTAPNPVEDYHAEIRLPFALPAPFDAGTQWVKGDMVNTVSFDRLNLIHLGKDKNGNRRYLRTPIGDELLGIVQRCFLAGVSLTRWPAAPIFRGVPPLCESTGIKTLPRAAIHGAKASSGMALSRPASAGLAISGVACRGSPKSLKLAGANIADCVITNSWCCVPVTVR
jgi:uncharacterized protein YifN (PemK superfamily)